MENLSVKENLEEITCRGLNIRSDMEIINKTRFMELTSI